jgi:hypothetical protein
MLVVVVLLPLSFWQWTMVSSTTVVAVPPPTAATAVAAAKAGGRSMVAASFDGGHTKISRRTTRGREGIATRGREGGTTFATTDLPLMLTPEAAMQLAVNTTNELSKTIMNMPNDFIGGGSKDTPHSEGECYVSKRRFAGYSTAASRWPSKWPTKWVHVHNDCRPGGRRGNTERVVVR